MPKEVIAQDPEIKEIFNRRVQANEMTPEGVWVQFHESSYFIEQGKYKEAPPIQAPVYPVIKVSDADMA